MSGIDLASLASASQEEAARQMSVCNACRYCEGLCAVFPAMELRRDFIEGQAGETLENLQETLADQAEFAKFARRVIEDLGYGDQLGDDPDAEDEDQEDESEADHDDSEEEPDPVD